MRHYPVWSRRCTREGCGLEHRVNVEIGSSGGPNGGLLDEYRRRGGEWQAPADRKVPPCEGRPA